MIKIIKNDGSERYLESDYIYFAKRNRYVLKNLNYLYFNNKIPNIKILNIKIN